MVFLLCGASIVATVNSKATREGELIKFCYDFPFNGVLTSKN